MRKRSLRKRLRGLDQEYQRIAPIIHSLFSSREAFRMEQATKLQRGPLAEILPEIRHTRNDVLRSTIRTDSPSRIGRKISFPDPVEAGLSEDQDPKPTTKPRKHRWERTPQQALVLGLYSHHLSVEEINEPNSKYPELFRYQNYNV